MEPLYARYMTAHIADDRLCPYGWPSGHAVAGVVLAAWQPGPGTVMEREQKITEPVDLPSFEALRWGLSAHREETAMAKIDPAAGRPARPQVHYVMYCHPKEHNPLVESFALAVDAAFNGRFDPPPLDYWVYPVVGLGAHYATAIDEAKQWAAAGILCLGDPFLGSSACRQELRHFVACGTAIPLAFSPVDWDDPRLTQELRDFAALRRYPLGDDSYLDVLDRGHEGELARFVGEFAQALEAWLRQRGLR